MSGIRDTATITLDVNGTQAQQMMSELEQTISDTNKKISDLKAAMADPPYLLFIAKIICQATGFTYDFSPWETSEDRFLIICNAIPAAWDVPAIARALPHWSFPEFFAQLENSM